MDGRGNIRGESGRSGGGVQLEGGGFWGVLAASANYGYNVGHRDY